MADAAPVEFDSSDDWQKLVLKLMGAGHTIIHERGTFRHKAFKKDFPADKQITIEGVPLLAVDAHPVLWGEVLPENADLCLDENANLLPQHEFEERYVNFLGWFNYAEGSDPGAEYIPNVKRFICQVPDRFSDSPGCVDVGFDARKPAAEERTHRYDPEHDETVEVLKGQSEAIGTTLKAVEELLKDRPAVPPPGPSKGSQVKPQKGEARA